jgi:hypothetical protein
MRKIAFFTIILPVFSFMLSTSFADCKVQDKINECNAALKDYTKKDGGYITP